MYDPKVGRFISEDPIGLWGGVNLYAYVRNNAARWVDPSGLETGNLNQLVPGPNGETATMSGTDNSALGTIMAITGAVLGGATVASVGMLVVPALLLSLA